VFQKKSKTCGILKWSGTNQPNDGSWQLRKRQVVQLVFIPPQILLNG
jgi:hypothetical protein